MILLENVLNLSLVIVTYPFIHSLCLCVIFTELRCRKLYPVPYMNLNCTGTRRGSQCAFSCDENAQLNGTRTTFCLRKDDQAYSLWDMDRQPFCEGWL